MAGPFQYQIAATVRTSGNQIHFRNLAPAFDVTVSSTSNLELVPALLDSGASRTVIPHEVAVRLNLTLITDDVGVTVASGQTSTRPLYVADLSFLGLNFPRHPVITFPDREHILIGREIMNRFKTTLDGPNRQFFLE